MNILYDLSFLQGSNILVRHNARSATVQTMTLHHRVITLVAKPRYMVKKMQWIDTSPNHYTCTTHMKFKLLKLCAQWGFCTTSTAQWTTRRGVSHRTATLIGLHFDDASLRSSPTPDDRTPICTCKRATLVSHCL